MSVEDYKKFKVYMGIFEPIKNNEEYLINKWGEVKGISG